MKETRERPVCHRAEDLVSYLYDEANAADRADFRNHLEQCDACRSEYAVFSQVHDSIQVWRSEALGAAAPATTITEAADDVTQIVRHDRKLSAWAALREFFTVSPLWLRGATAFAALLLCVLGVAMLVRLSERPAHIAVTTGERTYTQRELQAEVNRAVERTRAEMNQANSPVVNTNNENEPPPVRRVQLAVNKPKSRPRGLNRQEREQLAADLRLTFPADEEDLLLALPEQDSPHQ